MLAMEDRAEKDVVSKHISKEKEFQQACNLTILCLVVPRGADKLC